jgi:hypothetical protein
LVQQKVVTADSKKQNSRTERTNRTGFDQTGWEQKLATIDNTTATTTATKHRSIGHTPLGEGRLGVVVGLKQPEQQIDRVLLGAVREVVDVVALHAVPAIVHHACVVGVGVGVGLRGVGNGVVLEVEGWCDGGVKVG